MPNPQSGNVVWNMFHSFMQFSNLIDILCLTFTMKSISEVSVLSEIL